MRIARMLILMFALAGLAARAQGQESVVRMVVPFPAGATLDVIARLLADRMRITLDRPVVVENKPGAGGLIAAELVKGAPADGGTLFMATLAIISLNPHTYKALRYDPFVDFTPVAQVAQFQIALGVGAAVPAKTLAEYVALVKNEPKFGFYGTPAAGSLPHFFMIMIGRAAGVQLTHVPYKGSAPMWRGLAGGEISLGIGTISDLDALVGAGKAKVLAVTGPQRSAQHPEIPTLRESGFDLAGTSWYALYAPANPT